MTCLRGEIEFRRRNDSQAEALFRDALRLEPGLPDAHYGLSLLLQSRRELELALRHASFASNSSGDPRISAQVGLCNLELQDFVRAAAALARATRLDPNDKSSWNNLGIARRAMGDRDGARMAFARALQLDPNFDRAKANAFVLAAEGQAQPSADTDDEDRSLESLEADITRCEQLCVDEPSVAEHAVELARLYALKGDSGSGADVLRAFLARHPENLDATAALGNLLVGLRDFAQGLPLVEKVLASRPDDVDLLLSKSVALRARERPVEAGAILERVFELSPSFHNKGRLAASLGARCRYEESLRLITEMVEERPEAARDVLSIKLDALIALGRLDEALPELDGLIRSSPNDANYRFLRASVNLLNERFDLGWSDYAYRNLQSTGHLRMLPFPVWTGEPLEGKSIVIAAEQGLGDQVMFASCLPDVLAMRPRRLIVEVASRVAPTLARSFPQCEVIATKQDNKLAWVRNLTDVDCFAMIADLPALFRRRREDFPEHTGYLRADAQRTEHWRAQLDHIDGGRRPRIGVTWRGGLDGTRKSMRTMEVTSLRPLLDAVDATWVNLQYGDVSADLAQAAEAGMALANWPEAIQDLDEFAALICALDLVVTVCNTTVHYAGALGKEVWVMTPKVPEWRYGLAFDRMPWYPSSWLTRQDVAGEWDHLLDRVGSRLVQRFGPKG